MAQRYKSKLGNHKSSRLKKIYNFAVGWAYLSMTQNSEVINSDHNKVSKFSMEKNKKIKRQTKQ